MELVGWIGSMAFMLCGAPLAYSAWKKKRANENWGFLLLWTIGELFSIIYALNKDVLPILVNYVINLAFLGVVWRYQLWPISLRAQSVEKK